MGNNNILYIFGTGGHAKVVYDVAKKTDLHAKIFFVDLNPKIESLFNCNIISEDIFFSFPPNGEVIVAIGDNNLRKIISKKIITVFNNIKFATLVHPSAVIGNSVTLGNGTVVMANAVINIDSKIGNHCIINTGAIVEHDNTLEDYSSFAPRAVSGGNCHIQTETAISIGSVLKHSIRIGPRCVVGANSCVLKSFEESNLVIYGSPAKFIRTRSDDEKYL